MQPTHVGLMVQIGLNMGPRHARILGWAKSFVKRLTDQEMIDHDLGLIGAMSLFWSLIKSNLPTDLTDEVQHLLDANYPTLATRNVPEGK
jgi:hypothetical protein